MLKPKIAFGINLFNKKIENMPHTNLCRCLVKNSIPLILSSADHSLYGISFYCANPPQSDSIKKLSDNMLQS